MTAPLDKLALLRRDAWIPETVEGDGDRRASKFSGLPWLPAGDSWPACGHCGEPMNLLLQLDLAAIPARPEGCPEAGLLQLFYCTNLETGCEVQCEAFRPFAESVVVRRVLPEGLPAALDTSPVPNAYESRRITGWTRQDDFPGYFDACDSGVELSFDEEDALGALDYPLPGEKLLGWPVWVQEPDRPECPDCGRTMHVLFQIDSVRNLPHMFGDGGCAQLFQCADHPDTLGLAWQAG